MKPLIKICGIADLNFLNEVIQINEINYLGFILMHQQFFLRTIKKINLEVLASHSTGIL